MLFVLAAALPAMAQISSPSHDIGLRTGFVFPESNIPETFGIGLQSNVGQLAPNTRVRFEFNYWTGRRSQPTREQTWRLFSIAAQALADMPIRNYPVIPYAGGGVGFTINRWQLYGTDIPKKKNTDVDLAISMVVGLQKELSPELLGFFELEYTIAGNVDFFSIWLGVSHFFRR